MESTGEVIGEQLGRVIERTGVPRAILSDGGRNLQKGIALFRETHPEVTHSSHVVHKAALCLKRCYPG